MSCPCDLVGLMSSNYQGIYSASINGSTTVEIADDGLVLLGATVSNLNISAYAFLPGSDPFLGATCNAQAQAQIPWITKEDCDGNTFFIPRSGGKASITPDAGLNSSIIELECSPGIISQDIQADASGGPSSRVVVTNREDGFGLKYTGNPISINSARPMGYVINLGFANSITAYLQSFSLTVSPPDVARVQYSFVFAGVVNLT